MDSIVAFMHISPKDVAHIAGAPGETMCGKTPTADWTTSNGEYTHNICSICLAAWNRGMRQFWDDIERTAHDR